MPGGGNPDYSSLATWEAASDNDLSGYTGPVILDCYDSQVHNDGASLTGATNLSATIYRVLRSASGCADPWQGKAGTGANFYKTSGSVLLVLSENYSRIESCHLEISVNSSGGIYALQITNSLTGNKVINVAAKAANPGTGTAYPFYSQWNTGVLFYNCLGYASKTDGFLLANLGAGNSTYVISCSAIGNGGYGFNPSSATGTVVAFNCYAANNTGGNFREANWDSPSGWNASKDTTSDLGGTAGDNYKNSLDLITSGDLNSDYLATAEDLYAAGGAGDNYGRNPYNDLSSGIDFDDFFKNDASGETISKKDIVGYDRPTPDTADASWNVGASQYYTTNPPAGSTAMPVMMCIT